ncbi:hypothetical protein MKX03_012002, partial [Papaver bracteatum]
EVVALEKKLATSEDGLTKALRERDSASRIFFSSSRLASEISQERDDLRKAKEDLELSYLTLDQEYQSFVEGD